MRPPTKLLIAARVTLGYTQAELAASSGLAVRTIYNTEHGFGDLESVEHLVDHFQKNGIEFVKPEAGQGWGIFNRNILESFDDERKRNRLARRARKND